jgi:hypothetical protein
MATSLDPKQVVSFKELLMSQVFQQEALTRLLVEEVDIDQRGVFRDGEGGGSGDE